MGLSGTDKAKHPYFQEMQKEEEKKRWAEFMQLPESVEIEMTYRRAVEDYLHQLIKAEFYARNLKVTVEQVVAATSFRVTQICDSFARTRFYLIEKMLERFDLVKERENVSP